MIKILFPFSLKSALTLGLMMTLCSCQDDAQIRALGDQIRALESSQAQSKAEMSRLQLQMRSVQAEKDKLKEEKDKFQLQLDEATKALEAIQKDFSDYKAQYKLSIRKRAPGMELDVVEVDGRKYEKVKVRELTDASLTFMHQAGTMSVPLNQLKPEMQTRLGYETGVPVMAMTRNSGGTDGALSLDDEVDAVEKRLAVVRTNLENLKRSLAEETMKARTAELTSGSDPTIHREAAAALQIQINTFDVEQIGLLNKRIELSNKQRAKMLR